MVNHTQSRETKERKLIYKGEEVVRAVIKQSSSHPGTGGSVSWSKYWYTKRIPR